jgi:FkbM family methyltransferase
MSIKRRLGTLAADGLIGVTRLLGHQFTGYFVDRLMDNPSLVRRIRTPRGNIAFWCPNETTLWRAQTLLSKEPETIEWIDSFADGDVYWDVGANIGVYALYAAMQPGIRVLAFEPSPFNYYALCKNTALNGVSERLSSYCMAFNDRSELARLHMSTQEVGGALSNFGAADNFWGDGFQPAFSLAMMGYALDDFVARFQPAFPNHLKIDVDGIEAKIVAGGKQVLADRRLRSVSIELDEKRGDELEQVSNLLANAGLRFKHRLHSAAVDSSPFASVYNYLFVRER